MHRYLSAISARLGRFELGNDGPIVEMLDEILDSDQFVGVLNECDALLITSITWCLRWAFLFHLKVGWSGGWLRKRYCESWQTTLLVLESARCYKPHMFLAFLQTTPRTWVRTRALG
ncbi:unnamed protein product [Peronospora destructor]|uniref:Uncharacterized protein n=1 Tax=Peronospora destructor TaxID=86335 RepID=A0AAV0VBH2_9STRA|nr:unnamed protein product [Peronospora destructor]